MRRIGIILGLVLALSVHADQWKTHLAYNNVTQIAMSSDRVYAISDGSLFSVDKQSEQIRIYDRQTGLQGAGITCISYDSRSKQLLIGYKNGKIDILSSRGVQYLSGLYDKDMTQQKTIYHFTVHEHTAYLATHFGIQTIDLRENRLVDSYWLRPGGLETKVEDVLIAKDSIYAFTSDSLFCASLRDNLVDYVVWKREQRSGRVSPDPEKGKHYKDGDEDWYAGQGEGIIRNTVNGRLAYKPLGPLNNIPYRLHMANGRLYVVPGGRWSAQNFTPGAVMMYERGQWTNIPTYKIRQYPSQPVRDFMNVAVDPKDKEHFFVTSYGTGLYEFRGTQLVKRHFGSTDCPLRPAVKDMDSVYTRLDFAKYDAEGNLWVSVAGEVAYQLCCLDTKGKWHGMPLMLNNSHFVVHTPGGLIFDPNNPHRKWFGVARYEPGLCLWDDNGTWDDTSDDRTFMTNEWLDAEGKTTEVSAIYDMFLSRKGAIWMGTDKGVVIVDTADYFHSQRCTYPIVMDNNGENPMTNQRIKALCEDRAGRVWVGSEELGVYVLSPEADAILAHFTTDNSALPNNSILSLATDEGGVVFIGTADGLVQFDLDAPALGMQSEQAADDSESEQGTMGQWRLHFSYSNPTAIAATPTRIYAIANGALFYLDRKSDELVYLSKATGLNGTSISRIAYDARLQQLIIAYTDGRIDLLGDDDVVRQMPDILMKAGSADVTINHIAVGSKSCYLAMSYGILVINPRKAEIADTYYIGSEASSVNVQQVIEHGDTLYAFMDGRVYRASLQDNLVDYTYWKSSDLPSGSLHQAAIHRNELYVLLDNTLYRYRDNNWQALSSVPALQWLHSENGRLLLYGTNNALYQLGDDDAPIGLTGRYTANDAVYTQGEYWLARRDIGLVRLSSSGDEVFRADGPNSNFGYNITSAHNQIYAVCGGRGASQFLRYAKINIFDGSSWKTINASEIGSRVGRPAIDPVSLAVDPSDAGHFYVATYGTGVFEFRNYAAVTHYMPSNSTLHAVNTKTDVTYYTRTDGALTDKAGNLWVLNATTLGHALHIRDTKGLWHAIPLYSGGQEISFTTPGSIHIDQRNANRKWMMDQRVSQGVILLDDGGTPTDSIDDRCTKRSTFVDQNGNNLTPAYFNCIAQDATNRMWIGTNQGIIVIPSTVDFFSSNSCRRIIIPRNDGTGLGDYLLGDEQINCMAVDGGNRMWIGTANSGLYLIEDDTITAAHFTENNSLLPSNTIQSIAIMPKTGEVFVGTDNGIASYRSDASEAEEDFSSAYAFPNPVRPEYDGWISIVGLMEETVVNIVDAGGNLVCKTRSHGGTAVWDGKLKDGRRATAGVYTALCNAPSGKHSVVKILVIR